MSSQFGGLLFTLIFFVIALSVIVAIHEYGHYIVGRWTGIEADVFSLGFGPVIWSRMDRRGTRCPLAATSSFAAIPTPRAGRTKPRWRRCPTKSCGTP